MITKSYCSNCAAAIEPGDEFCGNCGAAIESIETLPPSAPQELETPAPVAVQPAAVENPSSRSSFTRRIVAGLSILLAGLAVGGGLAWFLKGDRSDNASGADADRGASPSGSLPGKYPSKKKPTVKDRVPPAFSTAQSAFDLGATSTSEMPLILSED